MPNKDKYRRYGHGGGVMGLSDRVKKQVRRDSERGGPDPKAEFRAKLEKRKMMRPSAGISGLGVRSNLGELGDTRNSDIEKLMELLRGRKAEQRLAGGGVIRGYQQGGIPANYAAPQAYGGYGMPGQFTQRQEHLSPEVAQQYADLTRGIMRAGTRGYEDVRYRGPQLAGFTGMEAAAQAGAGAYGRGAGPRGTLQAASTIGEAARGVGSIIPEQEALARQYGTMATGARELGPDAAIEQERIAGLMETSGTAAKTTGTEAETAFKGVGTGIKSLADTAAITQRGYGTTAGTLGKATELAQRGYGTTAGTATTTSLGLQRAKALEDFATKSAKEQRALGADLGTPTLQKGADLSGYMSQYTAGVTDPQLQGLLEFQKMQGQELGSQAAQAGAFGGLRQGVQAATQAQDVSRQAAEIIGKGQQEAFQSAQAAFQGDRAAQQQAQTAELAAERGALAAETGQQATQLSAEQQALQQQMGQQQFGAGQEQAAHQARMDAERFGLSTEQAAHQTAVGGRQANLAAQQAALAAAQQGRSQYEGALTSAAGLADVGTGRELQGYATAADMMGGQERAMGAGLGAYGQLAGIGGQQMRLGGQQQAEQMARFDMMNRYGGQQRQLQQASLDIGKAEHERAMQYPERQIGWMNQQLGALPYQNIVSEAAYAPQQGPLSTTLGALAGGQEAAAAWRANQPNAPVVPQPQASATSFSPTITPPVPGTYQGAVSKPPMANVFGTHPTNVPVLPQTQAPSIAPTPTWGVDVTATPLVDPSQQGGGSSPWGGAGGGLIRGYQGGGYMPPYGSARSGMAGGVAGAGMARVGMAGGGYLPFYGRVNR